MRQWITYLDIWLISIDSLAHWNTLLPTKLQIPSHHIPQRTLAQGTFTAHFKIIRMRIPQNLRNFNAHIMVAQHNFMFHEYFETLRLNLISASDVTCRKFKQVLTSNDEDICMLCIYFYSINLWDGAGEGNRQGRAMFIMMAMPLSSSNHTKHWLTLPVTLPSCVSKICTVLCEVYL